MEKEKLDKMYDICFFDLDGTIIDSSPGITNSVMYALEKFGIEETEREKLYKFIGPPLTDSFARFYGFDDEKSWKAVRSEEHTSELQSRCEISYAVFCLKKIFF